MTCNNKYLKERINPCVLAWDTHKVNHCIAPNSGCHQKEQFWLLLALRLLALISKKIQVLQL